MKSLKNKKGFTIVELVIVIAVIAILAAVLIPTFSNIVGRANEAAAQADAKNLWTQYCVDVTENNGSYAKFNGYIEVKVSNTDYYFAIKDGQLNTALKQAKTDGTNSSPVNASKYPGLYTTTSDSNGGATDGTGTGTGTGTGEGEKTE